MQFGSPGPAEGDCIQRKGEREKTNNNNNLEDNIYDVLSSENAIFQYDIAL